MKNSVILVLVMAMLLVLPACGGSVDDGASPNEPNNPSEPNEPNEPNEPTVPNEPGEPSGPSNTGNTGSPSEPGNPDDPGSSGSSGPNGPGSWPTDMPVTLNDTLIAAFEKALESLDTIETPLDRLPEFYTATGTMTYVDDDDVEHSPSPITFVQGGDTVALSAPEKLDDDRLHIISVGGIEQLKGAAEPYLEVMELTPLPGDAGFSATVPGEQLVGLLSDVADALPVIPFLYAVISGDSRALDVKNSLQALSGGEFTVTFTVTDGVLTGIDLSGPVNAVITYSDGAVKLELDKLGTLTVDLKDGIHAAGALSYGDGTTLSLDLDNDGTLSYIHYSTDVTGLAVEGKYDFDARTFSGYALTGNRGDRTKLELKIAADSSIPSDVVVLTKLSADELSALWIKLSAGEEN